MRDCHVFHGPSSVIFFLILRLILAIVVLPRNCAMLYLCSMLNCFFSLNSLLTVSTTCLLYEDCFLSLVLCLTRTQSISTTAITMATQFVAITIDYNSLHNKV